MIYNNIEALIGHTPVLKLGRIVSEEMAEVYLKLEFYNPGGSVKDRAALEMLRVLEEEGKLRPGMTIVEPTSGNTGISAAMLAAAKGYRLILVMPETMSAERRQMMSAYGAEFLLTDGAKGMSGAIEKAQELVAEKGYLSLYQFDNPANPRSHEKSTAKEIISDFDRLDAFVAGVGTGGTLSGTASVLRSHYEDIRVVAVEPAESAVLSGENPGAHKIQGIGAGFVPGNFRRELTDEVVKVPTAEAFAMTALLAEKEGLFLGISSGAAVWAALETARNLGRGKKVLALAPDSGHKYLSMEGLFRK